MESLKVLPPPLVAHLQPPEVAEPSQRPLHDIAEAPQAAAVGLVGAAGQEAEDAQRDHQGDHLRGAVGAVAEDAAGLPARPAPRTQQLEAVLLKPALSPWKKRGGLIAVASSCTSSSAFSIPPGRGA
jgi:hypothetical protein